MTTTTWRDIADQLTPEQVGELENWEALGDEPSTLLLFARAPICPSSLHFLRGTHGSIAWMILVPA